MLILLAAVWIGLYLSRRIAVPIKALVEASNEVSKGNLRVHVDCQAQTSSRSLSIPSIG